MDYAARTKYDRPGRAERYAARNPRRDAAEGRLLGRALASLAPPPADALDAPCGTGRVAQRLVARGLPTTGADLSPAMREATAARMKDVAGFRGVVALDLEAASPDPALAADLVVCFRFLHHLPDAETRGRVLRTLRALTRRHAIVSFHHPVSVHNARRQLLAFLRRRRSDRHTISPRRLRAEAAAAGFDVVRFLPQRRWLRELWVAVLRPA